MFVLTYVHMSGEDRAVVVFSDAGTAAVEQSTVRTGFR